MLKAGELDLRKSLQEKGGSANRPPHHRQVPRLQDHHKNCSFAIHLDLSSASGTDFRYLIQMRAEQIPKKLFYVLL